MAGVTAERLQQRMKALNLDQSELARRVGCSSAAINQLVNGKTQHSRLLPTIASRLGVSADWLLGESDEEQPAAAVVATEDPGAALMQIAEIDLSYGMGGSYLEADERVEAKTMPFAREWVRNFTKAAPEQLFFARGAGDSMMPTILDSDIVLIDRSQDTPRMGDQIWAFAFGDVGMIKRLRPRPDGSVAILSDNPSVPDDRAVDDELFIIGRVVAISRKV